MNLTLEETHVKKILNVHKHVDGPWFWEKYTAHPYIGCRSGCEFCYCRGKYSGGREPALFDTHIQVKINAVERLRGELFGRGKEIITVGDWQQPAEDRHRLSRGMLEVIRDLEFPLFIVERSPLLLRDLDLLTEINRASWVGVVISISSLDRELKDAFEPHSPGVKQRLEMMEKLAEAGIQVGTGLMPVLPLAGDREKQLEDVIRATKEHGGRFVIGGGLTMDGIQARRTLEVYRRLDPKLVAGIRKMYRWKEGAEPQYSPPKNYIAHLGLIIRELCRKHGLPDRMPRYIAPGPLKINKRIAERLFLETYELELQQANSYVIWAYRKAAWTVDEIKENIAHIFQEQGEAGLQKLPHLGKSISRRISRWLAEEKSGAD